DTELVCRLLDKNIKILYNANARSYLLRPVDFKSFCQRSYLQGQSLYYVACKHPEIIIPRYQLFDVETLYRSKYEASLEQNAAKIEQFEPVFYQNVQPGSEQWHRLSQGLCTMYGECFKGYWLKGYVEQLAKAGGARQVVQNQTEKDKAKRIVFISTNTPGYDVGSSNVRIYHILKILAGAGYELDFIYFNEYENDRKYIEALRGEVNFVRLGRTQEDMAGYFSRYDKRDISGVWITNIWDAGYASFSAELIKRIKLRLPDVTVYVDTMDFHYKKYKRKFDSTGRREDLAVANEFLNAERKLYHLADIVLTVSEREKIDIQKTVGQDLNVEVLSNIHSVPTDVPIFEQRRNICFIGGFRTEHNRDAAVWFIREVFPLIAAKKPDVEFHILGYGNDQYRQAIERVPNVKVIGYVEDADAAIAQYKVFVCPVRFGAGLKGKLGTAAAAGTAIVSTTIGSEGFDFIDGRDCYIADGAEEFAQKCLRLLEDKSLWQQFSRNGREIVSSKFGIETAKRKLLSLLEFQRKGRLENQGGSNIPNQTEPIVSVIVSCRNCERYLPECLDSIKRQTLQQWEAIIIDDCSSDGTRKIIEQYARQDGRFRAYYFDDNKGAYARRNFGIDPARADYIVIHDADDIMDERKLEVLYNEISREPKLAIVGSYYRVFLDEFTGLEYTDEIELPLEHSEISGKFATWAHGMSHGSAIIRKELLLTLGRYDENPYSSDTFFFAKAAEYSKYCDSVRFKNIPQCLTLLRRHADSQTQTLPTFDNRGRRAYYHKYCESKLNEVRQKIENKSGIDIACELGKCAASDFIPKYESMFDKWEAQPVEDKFLFQMANWSLYLLNTKKFVSCACTLNSCEKIHPGIAGKFKHFDLMRAMAFYSLDKKEQALRYLNCEIENHKSPAAVKFMDDFINREPDTDILSWCRQYDRVFDLRITDTEKKAVWQKGDKPLVTIIMPVYNGGKYLRVAIESVLIQNYKNIDMLIINDGSTDSSEEIIRSFNDNRIRYFKQENKGLAATHNEGIKKALGDYLIKVDADDYIAVDFVGKHLKIFAEHPQADLVYCDDQLIDEDGKAIRVITRPEYTDRRMLIRDLFRAGFPVVPFRTCIRKRVFEQIGFFDESLRIGEDYDIMKRFVKANLKAQHLNEPLYFRRLTNESISRRYNIEKARQHFGIVRSYAYEFSREELFPDINWERIPQEIQDWHFKCLVASTFMSIGKFHLDSNLPDYAGTALQIASDELRSCFGNEPVYEEAKKLMNRCKRVEENLLAKV
ncbi:MAG: glycosyltransferase, partial [Phycisphaerae bacterium]